MITGLALLACAAKKPPSIPPQQAPPPETTHEGRSTATFLFDPSNPALTLGADVRFDRPRPRDTKTLPVHPDAALAASYGTHREIVRIVIDDKGRVTQVGDSLLGASDGGPFAIEFRSAVDTAVRAWTFDPGVIRHVSDGNDLDGDGQADYLVTTDYQIVSVYYDVRFTFEIVDGKGTATVD